MYTYKNANHSLETTDTLENLENSPGCYGENQGIFGAEIRKRHIIILSRYG